LIHNRERIGSHCKKQRAPMTILPQMVIALAVVFCLSRPTPSLAETNEVRVIGSIGLQFLPTYVAVDNQLIEKHAKQLGIANPKVTFNVVTNGGAMNDALISGNSDVGEIPGPALVLFWNKTRGAQAIRGVTAGSEIPPVLVTIDPRIKSISDFGPQDRIAMPTVKISSYAIMMQMAAEQKFGWDQRFKFDAVSVPLNYAEIMSALTSGGTEVKSAIVVPPFTQDLLATGKARQVLSLDDVLGGHGTLNVFASTEKFHSQNPKAFAAVKAALIEAMDFIRDNPREAAEIYIKREPNKHGVEWIENLIKDKTAVNFTADPHRFEKLATFMHRNGSINAQPASWKDLFFDEGAGLNGN
jgi:NitT/TauT family transport system substrate-binding protein